MMHKVATNARRLCNGPGTPPTATREINVADNMDKFNFVVHLSHRVSPRLGKGRRQGGRTASSRLGSEVAH